MALRYEAWTVPWDPGGFRRKVAMLPVIEDTGQGSIGFLSYPGDSSVNLSTARFDRVDELASDTESSLITVFDCDPDGTQTIIDEWILSRSPKEFSEEKIVGLSGPGLLASFEKVLVYAFDYPKQPTIQADWIWGVGEDADDTGLIRNGTFETTPFPNGGFEDGNTGSWQRTEADGNLFSTSGIQAIFSAVDARSGSWLGTVLVDNQGDGIRRSISGLVPGDLYTITGWINEPSGAGDRLRAGIGGASVATHTNAYEEDDYWWAEIGNATQGNGASTGAYQQVTLTFRPEAESVELVVIYDDINALDFYLDDFSISGENVGLDPWYAYANTGLNPSPASVVNVFEYSTAQSHGGASSVRLQGVDDAFYGQFGQIGYGHLGIGQDVRLTPGKLYTYTVWVRHDGSGTNGANERIRIVLNRLTPKGTLTQTITGDFRPSGPGAYHMAGTSELIPQNTWTKIQLTVVADSAEIRAEINYVGSNLRSDVGSFNSPNIYIDDVSIHEGLPATTIGDIWQRLLDDCTLHHAADPRGTVLDWVDYSSFDAALDSNGNAWDNEITFLARWGSNLIHVLDDTYNRGYEAELVRKAAPSGGKTHDFHLYNPGGRDSTPSSGISNLHPMLSGETTKRNPSATAVLVGSPDGSWSEDTDATTLANFNRLEAFIQDSEATGPISRQLLADNFFAFEAANQNAVKFNLVANPGTPRPFVAYRPGDTIPMTMVPGLAKTNRRVQRIDYADSHPTKYAVVGSRLLHGEAAALDLIGRMWRRMNRPGAIDKKQVTGGKGEGTAGGPFTITIAASDASARSKAKADYKCDGTNDQEELRQAYAEVQASPFGGVLQLSEGHFICALTTSDAAVISTAGGAVNQNGTSIRGMGPGNTVIQVTGSVTGGTSVLDLSGNQNNEVRDLTIEDDCTATHEHAGIRISTYGRVYNVHGYMADEAEGVFISTSGADEWVIRDCNITFGWVGIYGVGSGFGVIDGCNIYAYNGIYLTNSGGFRVTNNYVWSFGGANTNNGGCIRVSGAGADESLVANNVFGEFDTMASEFLAFFSGDGFQSGMRVIGNFFFNPNGHSLADSPTVAIAGINIFSGNTIYGEQGTDGLQVWGDNENVYGNFVTQARHGINILNANHAQVHGNLIYACYRHGIQVDTANDAHIHGNKIREVGNETNNTYDGIFLMSSDRAYVHGNKITANTSLLANMRYGVNVSNAACDNCVIVGNDFRPLAEFETDALNDAGTGTVLTYPNDATYGDNFT